MQTTFTRTALALSSSFYLARGSHPRYAEDEVSRMIDRFVTVRWVDLELTPERLLVRYQEIAEGKQVTPQPMLHDWVSRDHAWVAAAEIVGSQITTVVNASFEKVVRSVAVSELQAAIATLVDRHLDRIPRRVPWDPTLRLMVAGAIKAAIATDPWRRILAQWQHTITGWQCDEKICQLIRSGLVIGDTIVCFDPKIQQEAKELVGDEAFIGRIVAGINAAMGPTMGIAAWKRIIELQPEIQAVMPPITVDPKTVVGLLLSMDLSHLLDIAKYFIFWQIKELTQLIVGDDVDLVTPLAKRYEIFRDRPLPLDGLFPSLYGDSRAGLLNLITVYAYEPLGREEVMKRLLAL